MDSTDDAYVIYHARLAELKAWNESDEFEVNFIMAKANIQWEWEEARRNGKDISFCEPCGAHYHTLNGHDCTKTWWYSEGYDKNPNLPHYECCCKD